MCVGGGGREGRACPHPTSALGAVVHRPLVSVLVHDAVVDANAAVDADAVFARLVLVDLGKTRGENVRIWL